MFEYDGDDTQSSKLPQREDYILYIIHVYEIEMSREYVGLSRIIVVICVLYSTFSCLTYFILWDHLLCSTLLRFDLISTIV